MGKDVAIAVEAVSKKYCRSLRRSMLYGLRDIARDALRLPLAAPELRADEFWALRDVSFTLERGECLGVIGPNGAGKSTLLKLLNGIMWPDAGTLRVRGRMGALIEVGAGFHPLLSGRENVYVNGAILGLSRREINAKIASIIDFAEIGEFIDSPVKHYSSGMIMRLGFAIAIHAQPEVLLIDEALAVGDIRFRTRCYGAVNELSRQGTASVLVSHNMHDVLRVCGRVAVIEDGRMTYLGDVGGGICHYQSLVGPPRPAEDESFDTVCVNRVSVTGAHGEATLRTGEAASFVISLSSSEPVINPVVVVYVALPDGEPIASFSSSVLGTRLSLPKGQSQVHVRIAELPLLMGAYRVHVAIYDERGERLFQRRYNAGEFEVTQPVSSILGEYFHFRIRPSSWTVNG